MDLRELLITLVRWAHASAAVALVGSSAFYCFVLAPALARGDPAAAAIGKAADAGFKELLDLCVVVLIISGGLLMFERLSSGAASTAYVLVLALKIGLSVWFYRLALVVRRGRGWSSREARLMVGSGFVVVFLAAVLKALYEGGLHS